MRVTPFKYVRSYREISFLPFLYHTRTIARSREPRCSCCLSTSRSPAGQVSAKSDTAPSDFWDVGEEQTSTFPRPRISHPPTRSPNAPRRSTLTSSERRIFTRLADNTGDDSRSRQVKSQCPKDTANQDAAATNDHFDAEEEAEITSIFSSVVKELTEQPSKASSATDLQVDERKDIAQLSAAPAPHTTHHQALSEPAQLSKVYSKLLAFRDSPIDSSSEKSKELAGIDLFPLAKSIAKREAKKICQEMDDVYAQGKGDIGIWQICESKIFAMLEMIDQDCTKSLSESAETDRHNPHDRRRRSPKSIATGSASTLNTSGVPVGEHPPIDIPDGVPVVPVVAKAYPFALLHAARLLHRHFPMSQFSTQLLETIKSHGRVSFVMAASVDLCNEFISFRWRVYNDLPYVGTILEEMEEVGVKFNWNTLSIIEEIRKQRQSDNMMMRRQDGAADSATWWWDSEATQTSYRNLIGLGSGKTGWISRIRDHIRKEEERKDQLEKLSKQVF